MKELEQIAQEGRIDENSSLTDRQSIIINVSIQEVWNKLTAIDQWPEWNKDIKWAKGVAKKQGDVFSWNHHGKNYQSILEVAKAPHLFTFVAKSGLIKSIFSWTLDETDENQTVISMEQSSKGFMLFLFMNHGKVHYDMLHWLEQLRDSLAPNH